jgi:hypothetical protein
MYIAFGKSGKNGRAVIAALLPQAKLWLKDFAEGYYPGYSLKRI